jgi:hypothetical protein
MLTVGQWHGAHLHSSAWPGKAEVYQMTPERLKKLKSVEPAPAVAVI